MCPAHVHKTGAFFDKGVCLRCLCASIEGTKTSKTHPRRAGIIARMNMIRASLYPDSDFLQPVAIFI
jgi:hypothetical protein